MSIGCGKDEEKLHSIHTVLLRRFACRPAAFLAVRCSQTEREPSLAYFKLHTARVRVCIGLAELIEGSYGVGGQPVLEAGVVGADALKVILQSEIQHRAGMNLVAPQCLARADMIGDLCHQMERGRSFSHFPSSRSPPGIWKP